MSAKAGEKAEKTGDFRCAKCHEKVHVKSGDKIPKCPNCGSDTYDTRQNEPGNKSS
jgi:Zn finger protein HypA/HybF involved in hydrogenase expression